MLRHAYLRGRSISLWARCKEQRKNVNEEDFHNLEKQHAQTQDVQSQNVLTQKRLEFKNLMTTKAERKIARTWYHYYEKGEKTGKLLSLMIKKQEQEQLLKSIKDPECNITNDPIGINKCFENCYQDQYG